MKKYLSVLLALFLLTGCGSMSKNDMSFTENTAPEICEESTTNDSINSPNGSDSNSIISNIKTDNVAETRKIIKNSNIDLETLEFDKAIENILAEINDLGGYVGNQTVSGKSLNSNSKYYERKAEITARIPADKLTNMQKSLSEKYNITSQNDYINDITDSYYDVEARLNTLKTQEKKLLELLEKATVLEDIIELEKALSDCRYQIDSYTGQIKRMDNQVAYSTLTLYINEVFEYQEVVNTPKTFGEKISDAFKYSGRQIMNLLSNTLFFIIEDAPVMLIFLGFWGLVIFLIVMVIKKIVRVTRKNRPTQLPYTPANYNLNNNTNMNTENQINDESENNTHQE